MLAKEVVAKLCPRMPLDGFRAERTSLPRIGGAWRDVRAVRRIASDPEVLALLGRLYGLRALPFQTLNFLVGAQQH